MFRLKSPFLPVATPIVALIAALLRWWLQGSGNLYTAVEKRFYVPDPDLGWRVSEANRVWLGLDVCAVIAASAIVLANGGCVVRRHETDHAAPARGLRAVAWLLAAVSVVAPIAAIASGSRPADARDALPVESSTIPPITGIAGGVVAPAGRYEVVAHDGT